MPSLVENILAIEKEASDAVTRAHEEAAAIARSAEQEIEAYRESTSKQTEARIAAFRQAAESRHQEDLARAEGEFKAASEAIEQVSAEAVKKQVDFIVSTFREL